MPRRTLRPAIAVCLVTSLIAASCLADGQADGKKSLGGSGEMIQLEIPSQDRMLDGIQIHGSRYGTKTPPPEQFLVYIMNRDRTKVVATELAPYSLFERGEEKWVTVRFDQPIEFPADGWLIVDFRAGRTQGVYVSYDSDTDGKRSMTGLPGTVAKKPDFTGDWMIRPIPAP